MNLSPYLLELRDVAKSFGGVRALRGVDLTLTAGEVHALVGENGAGKSTLGKIVAGIVAHDSGTVAVEGRQVAHFSPLAARQLGVAAIQQRPALLPDLTVAENIALAIEPPGRCRPIRWRERNRRAAEWLAAAGADIDPTRQARDLSMPEQQLVEIAKAVGGDSRIVVMDEPTASLGDREVDRLFAVIAALRQRGVGIVYVSHRLDELFALADRATVLRDGVVVANRTMADLDRTELIRLMVGRAIDASAPKPLSVGMPVLEARGLSSRSAGIANIDLVVRAGEIVGLAGLVGAGRTELARVLFGVWPADSGELRLAGKPVQLRSPGDALRHGIAYVPEDRCRHGIVPELSVAANIALPNRHESATTCWLDRHSESALAHRYVQNLGIKTPSTAAAVNELSGGNQQKVALARMLAVRPQVIVLDEPTQGVDIGAKVEIHDQIRQLAESGVGVLMISSEMPEIIAMCDRIGVMRGGRLVGMLDRRNATQERILEMALSTARPAA